MTDEQRVQIINLREAGNEVFFQHSLIYQQFP